MNDARRNIIDQVEEQRVRADAAERESENLKRQLVMMSSASKSPQI